MPDLHRLRAVNIDDNFDYAHERGRLAAAGVDLIVKKCRGEEETIRACAGADIVLIENADQPFNAGIISTLDRCRAIIRYGVGLDNIDIAAATATGIVVANTADFCTEEVSDHAVALLLACARRIVAMDRNIRRGGWNDFARTGELRRVSQLTLGLVGIGRIGRAVLQKMSGFRLRVLATDPFVPAGGGPAGVEMVSLARLAAEADLISVHTPLGPTTRGLIGEEFLRAMKPDAFLINTSRGPVVEEAALIRVLREKRIGGAGLDVFATEPLPAGNPLREIEEVILTPHYAASSRDSIEQLQRTVADSVVAIAGGFWPPFPANPQVTPRHPLRKK